MKVNMNQIPDEKPESKKPKTIKKSVKEKRFKEKTSVSDEKQSTDKSDEDKPAGSNGIYKEALKEYAEKYKHGLRNTDMFNHNKFWIIVIVILFFVFISVNSRAAGTKNQLTVQLKRAVTETEKLNTAIDEVKTDLEEQARIDSIKLTEDEEELARNNAIEQGTNVANWQNAYRSLDIQENYQAFTDNKNALDACFGDNDKNARTPWSTKLPSTIPGTWEFVTKASFSGNTAKVLWLCYADEDNTLLAYCTAKYNADTELFTNVDLKITAYAQANLGTDDDEAVNDMEQSASITDMINSLQNSDIESESPAADEEFNEETIEINNELFDSRSSLKDAAASGELEGDGYSQGYDIGLPDSEESEE